ncbi:proton-coupled amino acid transporter-like protein pathetic [Planococcus citri]|uniref:proton-coupled amino acid transporter-like protein pathetic n=1 Tax=Planococcus citri TaxID=170843 RepID=UPI0031F99178
MDRKEKFVIQLNNSATDGTIKNKLSSESPPQRNLTHYTSDLGALLHIVKGSLGAGLLAMPFAFKNAGLIMGTIGLVITGIIVTHTTAMLINCSQGLCEIFNRGSMSYADTAEYAFLHGFKGRVKHHAPKARMMANFFLFITYYGVNICYVLLIAETAQQVLEKHTGFRFDIRWYTFASLFIIYPVSIIRWMKFLVPFSAAANSLLCIGLFMVFWEIFRKIPPIDSVPSSKPLEFLPIFIATAFLSLEGVGTIMPVENEMKNPKHLTNRPGLMYYGMVVVVLANTVVGFFGYLRYGDASEAVISLNLPDDWLSEAVKLSIALSILFTFGLQLTVSVKVVWDGVSKPTDSDDSWFYYVVRSLLIFGCVGIATALPSLKGVIGLIGSVGFSMLGIFCPALIELTYLSTSQPGFVQWYLIKDVTLMVFSLFCGIVGTYSSILEIWYNPHK